MAGSPKHTKKFTDMNTHRIKVTYNIMGEPIREKVNLVHRESPPPRIRKAKRCPKTSSPQSIKSSYSLSDLKKVLHVLRQILLGKANRILKCKSTRCDQTLSDIMRFYCQISFGASLLVAEERQTELWNAILALQSTSPLIKVMKRMLGIPGIQKFSPSLEDLYVNIWAWMIKHDMLTHTHTKIPTAHLDCISNINGESLEMELLFTSKDCFMQCIQALGKEKYCFSSSFCDDVHNLLISLLPNHNQCKCESIYDSFSSDKIDVDKAILLLLQHLEKQDETIASLEEAMFSERAINQNLVISTRLGKTISTKDVKPCENMSQSRNIIKDCLSKIFLLLKEFVMYDIERNGLCSLSSSFAIIKKWYSLFFNQAVCNHDLNHLTNIYGVEKDGDLHFDYLEFIGMLHAIVLEEARVTSCSEFLAIIYDGHRGIEMEYYSSLEKYIQIVRVNKEESFMGRESQDMTSKSESKDFSNRSLYRIRPESRSRNDFITKWVPFYSVKGMEEIDHNELNEQRKKLEKSISPQKDRSKTPLKIIDQSIPTTCTHIPLQSIEPSIPISIILDQQTDKSSNNDVVGANIYIRFPDVEPKVTKIKTKNMMTARSNSSDVKNKIDEPNTVEKARKQSEGGDSNHGHRNKCTGISVAEESSPSTSDETSHFPIKTEIIEFIDYNHKFDDHASDERMTGIQSVKNHSRKQFHPVEKEAHTTKCMKKSRNRNNKIIVSDRKVTFDNASNNNQLHQALEINDLRFDSADEIIESTIDRREPTDNISSNHARLRIRRDVNKLQLNPDDAFGVEPTIEYQQFDEIEDEQHSINKAMDILFKTNMEVTNDVTLGELEEEQVDYSISNTINDDVGDELDKNSYCECGDLTYNSHEETASLITNEKMDTDETVGNIQDTIIIDTFPIPSLNTMNILTTTKDPLTGLQNLKLLENKLSKLSYGNVSEDCLRFCNEKRDDSEFVNVFLIDQWDWESFFGHNECNLLSLSSKFFINHSNLKLYRARHHLDDVELMSVSNAASVHIRQFLRKQLFQLVDNTKMVKDESAAIYLLNDKEEITKPCGIGLQFLTTNNNKLMNNPIAVIVADRPQSRNQSRDNTTRRYSTGSSIVPIKYKVSRTGLLIKKASFCNS